MKSPLETIEEQAINLPAAEREKLAHKLFASVHNQELNEVDHAWLTVAEERLASYRSSEDKGIAEDEFFARVKKDLGWK